MNFANWNKRLDTVCTNWAVVLAARAFLQELPDADIETLPAACRPEQLNDAADITSCAYELESSHLARRGSRQDRVRRAEIVGFFRRAAWRVAALSSRKNLSEAIAMDRAVDTQSATSIGPSA